MQVLIKKKQLYTNCFILTEIILNIFFTVIKSEVFTTEDVILTSEFVAMTTKGSLNECYYQTDERENNGPLISFLSRYIALQTSPYSTKILL